MLLNKGISISYFLRLIKWDILAIVIYATVIGLLDHYLFLKGFEIPLAIPALVGTLISLLLAFRTSQSYERWWEARTIWGAIVNDSRTLVRQLLLFLPEDEEKQGIVQRFAERQFVWCFVLTAGLRKVSLDHDSRRYIERHHLESDNLPNLLLSEHAKELRLLSGKYRLDPNVVVQLDATLQRITDSMGGCERIKNTVFPRSYGVLIHFLIYVLMSILPFGLEDDPFLLEIIVASLVPILFIAIERTAIIMQDPFEDKPTDTPMITLSSTIERNLREMSEMPAATKRPAAGSFYVM